MAFLLRRARMALLLAVPLMMAACGDDEPAAETTTTTAGTTTVPATEPADPRDPRVGGAECEAITLPSGEVADEFDLINVTCDEAHAFVTSWSAAHDSQFAGEERVDAWFCVAEPNGVSCIADDQTQAMGWHVNPT